MVIQVKCCQRCKSVKPVCDGPESAFAINQRRPDGRVRGWRPRCKPCERLLDRQRWRNRTAAKRAADRARERARYVREVADPERAARRRERDARAARERRKRDPEKVRARGSAAARSWRRRHPTAAREGQRLKYRLQREREGRPARPTTKGGGDGLPLVPVGPLVCFLEKVWLPRCAGSWASAAASLGVSARNMRRMRSGEQMHVTMGVVDRALLDTPYGMHDLYPVSEHPELYEV